MSKFFIAKVATENSVACKGSCCLRQNHYMKCKKITD